MGSESALSQDMAPVGQNSGELFVTYSGFGVTLGKNQSVTSELVWLGTDMFSQQTIRRQRL